MKKLIVAFVILFSSTAYACKTYTVINPDGTIKICVICDTIVNCM